MTERKAQTPLKALLSSAFENERLRSQRELGSLCGAALSEIEKLERDRADLIGMLEQGARVLSTSERANWRIDAAELLARLSKEDS